MAARRPRHALSRPAPAGFVGAVLAGGASSRMGRDKAFVEIDGEPMVRRVATALARAGATGVVVVGGDRARIEALSLAAVPDEHPGEGPLGGVLTALGLVPAGGIAVIVACDLRLPSPEAVAATAAALARRPEAAVALPESEGRLQWMHAGWRPALARPVLAEAFSLGTRAIWRAAAELPRVVVRDVDPRHLADVDTPDDLPPNVTGRWGSG